MSNWQQKAYSFLTPLFLLLKETVKSGPVIHMDETTVQDMEEEGRLDTLATYKPMDMKAMKLRQGICLELCMWAALPMRRGIFLKRPGQ